MFDQVNAIVSDTTRRLLGMPGRFCSQNEHVLSLAYVVNLEAEVFQNFSDFKHAAYLVTMIKSPVLKKPGRKRH